MARKLFERQAIRRRTGALASGVAMVVYTDAAGLVPADIATSVGGSAIPGSVVTSADIAGLGPAALQFWGPPDGTDTLYIRVPSDTSLGVQEIEAATDPRLDALEAGSASGVPGTIFDAKGDLIAASAADTAVRLPVGSNSQILVPDSTTSSGLRWIVHEGPLPITDPRVATVAGDAGDHALAVQRAIDLAQTAVISNTTGAPSVSIPPGEYRWSTSIAWKSANLITHAAPNVGVRIWWDGASGATVITKDNATYAGGISWGRMEGLQFLPGTHEPNCWLDIDAGNVDFGFRLKEVAFIGGVGSAIRMAGFYNCHWEHVRFDGCGSGTDGFAIRVTTASGDNLGTFALDGFTYDNNRGGLGGNGAEGMILVDSSANAANLGTFALKSGRIEANSGWSGRKGLIVLKIPDSGANPRSLGLAVEDVTYQDVAGTSGEVLLYHDTALTTAFPSLVLKNFRQSGLSAIVGGGLSAGYMTIPLQPLYGYVAVAQGDNEIVATNIVAQIHKPVATQETVVNHSTLGASETFDLTLGNYHTGVLDANCAFTFSSGATSGKLCSLTLKLTQDGTGGRTITWPGSVDWAAGTAPTLSTGAGKVSVLTFTTDDGGTTWLGFLAGDDLR